MGKDTFEFITPRSLRENITESIRFVGWLWVVAQQIDKEYQDEMVRTIILYNIGIIEALLLFRAKKIKLRFYEDTYLQVASLPRPFQRAPQELVIAYREKAVRPENRVWLHELIKEQKAFLGDSLCKEIMDLQNIRNTFHLSKPRRMLSLKKAAKSFDAMLELTEKTKRELS